MENTIDRKAYRRNTYNDSYERLKKEEPIKRSNSLVLNKIINAMLLFLFVLLLKLFYLEKEFEFIKETFNSGYSFEYITQVFNNKINKIIEEDEIKTNVEEGTKEEKVDTLIEEISSISGEIKYEEAVEGVNILMDDSENIKKNFEIKSPLEGTITSEFGSRTSDSPIVSTYHKGLDIAANTGTNIIAAHSGTVIQAGENGSYGKCIIIENGKLTTLYAHCSEILVEEGENIKIGEIIAKVGMTGNATGPHLHFEVKYEDRLVNPKDII